MRKHSAPNLNYEDEIGGHLRRPVRCRLRSSTGLVHRVVRCLRPCAPGSAIRWAPTNDGLLGFSAAAALEGREPRGEVGIYNPTASTTITSLKSRPSTCHA